MSTPPRSAPGKPARVSPMTKTASNSSPLAWWTVMTWTPVRSGGAPPSPRKPISASPASRVARPRASRAGSASAISRARRSSAARPARRPAPSAPPAASAAALSPQPSNDRPQRVGRGQLGRRPARLAQQRGQDGGGLDERPRDRSPRGGGGRDRVGGGGPGDVEPPVGGDAQVGLGVGRVGGGPQPGHGRAHLAALEEAEAAAHLVGDSGPLKGLGHRARLQPHGPHEDRLLLQGDAGLGHADDLLRHGARLPVGVGRSPEARVGADRAVAGDDVLGRAVRDRGHHGRRGVEDRLGRAVVDLEAELGRLGEAAPEVGDVLGRRPPEAVDALVVVAHHHEAVGSPRHQVEQLGLGVVGVLELVHEDVARGRARGLEAVRVRPQQVEGPHDREAEVLPAVLGQPALVGLEHAGDLDLPPRPVGGPSRPRSGEPLVGPGPVLIGAHELVAALVDAVDQVGDQAPAVTPQVVLAQVELVEPLEEHQHAVLGARHRRRGQEAALDAVHPRQLERVRVEGRDPQRLVGAPDQLLGAGPQLHGGLAGEGEGDDLGGRGAPLDQPRQAVAEHPRLAGPRPRQHQRGPAHMGHGGALLGGQLVQHRTGHGRPEPGRRTRDHAP